MVISDCRSEKLPFHFYTLPIFTQNHFGMVMLLLLFRDFISCRAVLGSKQNWEEGRDFHVPSTPTQSLPYGQHPPPEWYPRYNQWDCTDTSWLLPRVRSLHRAHSWCGIFCGFRYLYSDVFLPSQYRTGFFHCPESALSSSCSSLPCPQPLAPTDLFAVSLVVPFPEHHRVGIKQYVASMGWLLSLCHMRSGSPHVFSWLDGSSLFRTE